MTATDSRASQTFPDTQGRCAGSVQASSSATRSVTSSVPPLARNQTEGGSATITGNSLPIVRPSLADPLLALSADVLDDAERTRISNENRLRQLTRDAVDKDGEERGFGLDPSDPEVRQLAALVEMLKTIEHQATLNLQRHVRRHPLGPWIKAQRGVGDKQGARLLAVIGDPYWHSAESRPRTVSELWAYCGLHTLPVGQIATDTHDTGTDGFKQTSGDLDQRRNDLQMATVNVAARRRKGQRANWSTAAKMRTHLISEAMLKAGNREVYDLRKAATEGRLHAAPCVRCGPAGKPAQPGSSWSAGHRHADALRVQGKELLKELWREARRLHGVE